MDFSLFSRFVLQAVICSQELPGCVTLLWPLLPFCWFSSACWHLTHWPHRFPWNGDVWRLGRYFVLLTKEQDTLFLNFHSQPGSHFHRFQNRLIVSNANDIPAPGKQPYLKVIDWKWRKVWKWVEYLAILFLNLHLVSFHMKKYTWNSSPSAVVIMTVVITRMVTLYWVRVPGS